MDVKFLRDIPPWEWPEDAGTTFLALLRDGQAEASDRLLAAELAGDFTVINDEIAEALLTVVRNSDESDALRSTAALSFGAALEHVDTMGFDDDEEPVLSPETFQSVQRTLRDLFFDATVPEAVRRHILEVSVRAPEDWHEEAVRAAYVSDDEAWRLTAVFCMRFIDGFEDLILEALNSGQADMRYQAVCAAGNWGLDAAWPHVVPLATTTQVDKDLQLAAIDAVASIRPHEAPDILGDLTDSDDEDIVEATFEALTMAEGLSAYDDDDDDDDEFF